MLKQGLLAEGGSPDNSNGMLNAINDDKSLAQSTMSMRKSRISNDTSIQGLPQFSQYDELFSDLTKRNFIDTDIDVVNVIITYDSKYAIAICADSDEHFELQGYSLKTLERVFTKILKKKIKLFGSGRTDSGVHALGQSAHFNSISKINNEYLFLNSVNFFLKKKKISILNVKLKN